MFYTDHVEHLNLPWVQNNTRRFNLAETFKINQHDDIDSLWLVIALYNKTKDFEGKLFDEGQSECSEITEETYRPTSHANF